MTVHRGGLRPGQTEVLKTEYFDFILFLSFYNFLSLYIFFHINCAVLLKCNSILLHCIFSVNYLRMYCKPLTNIWNSDSDIIINVLKKHCCTTYLFVPLKYYKILNCYLDKWYVIVYALPNYMYMKKHVFHC